MNVGSDRALYVVVLSLPLGHFVVCTFFVGLWVDFPSPFIALGKQVERSRAGSKKIALVETVIPIMGSLRTRAFLLSCVRGPIWTQTKLFPVYFVF